MFAIWLIINKMTWKNSLAKKRLSQMFKITSSFVKKVQDGENWNTRLDGTLIFQSFKWIETPCLAIVSYLALIPKQVQLFEWFFAKFIALPQWR